ncbi:MAG: histidine--tRNA ligase [Candidatus Sulfotelmatobacter sp.]|jgi:histidyl-tRNA synthetase
MIKAVRGTRDLLPPDTALWNFVEAAVRDVFRAYNFQEIRTPIFEETALFSRSVGEETDIVSKEMYTTPPKEMFTWSDGVVPGVVLEEAWLEQYGYAFEDLNRNVRLPDGSAADFVGDRSGVPTIVEVMYKPDKPALIRAEQKLRAWRPNDEEAELVIAVPEEHAKNIPGLTLGTEVHSVRMPSWLEARNSYTLRPENTAGVVRAYIEHKLWDRGLNKLYYIGPQFRRERPQKGRYRQFYQIGAEVIGPASAGSESPARDAEVLEMLATLLDRLGISDWNLELNSVGCANDRARFNEALRQALEPVVGKMCADCQRRAVTNPLRVFDCKVPEDQPIIEKLPRISQFLDEPCRTHFEAVQEILKAVGVEFQINDRLVRGLDYYTRTAFEFTHGALGAQNAILGGGRYDGLSESLGGPAAPGIGFAIGEDRLVMSLKETAEGVLRKPDVYVAPLGAGMNGEAARLARELRQHDLVVELGDESFRLKKSFEAATKAGAKYILIVGENEVKADAFSLKNLATGEQVQVARGDLAHRIQEK